MNRRTLPSKAAGLALASLVAATSLALSACAEREPEDTATTPAATAEPEATTPAATTPPPAANAGASGAITEADRAFLATALAANQHELQAAQLGIQKAQDERVRNYAQTMQQDHSQLGNRMQPLVQQAGITMAEPAMPMTELETASGEAFDTAFVQQMVTDHEKAVADFEAAANDPAHSAQVRAVASEALPTLQQHLQQAQSLAQALDAGTDAAGTDAAGTEPTAEPPPEQPAGG